VNWSEWFTIASNPGTFYATAIGGGNILYGGADFGDATLWYSNSLSDSFQEQPLRFSGIGVIRDIAYGDGLFVLVKDDGPPYAMRSATGASWATTSSGVNANELWCAVFGAGTFLIGGFDATNAGALWVSTDGALTWTRVSLPGLTFPVSAVYGSGRFMVVGSGVGSAATSWTSVDGMTWSAGSLMGGGNLVPLGLAVAGSTWTAVGASGTFWASTNNGGTWSVASLTGSRFNDVTYGADRFVAVGEGGAVATSPDGLTWTFGAISPGGSGTLNSISYGM
jgi:hypothetical protein